LKNRDVIGGPLPPATPNFGASPMRDGLTASAHAARLAKRALRALVFRENTPAAELDAIRRSFYIIAEHIAGLKVDAIRHQQQ
jgi:hypothetical protein